MPWQCHVMPPPTWRDKIHLQMATIRHKGFNIEWKSRGLSIKLVYAATADNKIMVNITAEVHKFQIGILYLNLIIQI